MFNRFPLLAFYPLTFYCKYYNKHRCHQFTWSHVLLHSLSALLSTLCAELSPPSNTIMESRAEKDRGRLCMHRKHQKPYLPICWSLSPVSSSTNKMLPVHTNCEPDILTDNRYFLTGVGGKQNRVQGSVNIRLLSVRLTPTVYTHVVLCIAQVGSCLPTYWWASCVSGLCFCVFGLVSLSDPWC